MTFYLTVAARVVLHRKNFYRHNEAVFVDFGFMSLTVFFLVHYL